MAHLITIELTDDLRESKCYVTETLYKTIKDIPEFTIRSRHGCITVDITNTELLKQIEKNDKENDPEFNLGYMEGGVAP